jgi:hypothetical protein
MRISLLLQREPFPEILERTLSVFCSEYFDQDLSVRWYAKRSQKPHKEIGQVWLCNPYLNAIFISGTNQTAIQPVINEYSRSPIWWRRPFQKIYVLMASHIATKSLLASYFILVSPPIKEPERYVILGGNHHIRLIDSKDSQCFVISKAGFSRDMIARDIETRQQHAFLPAPQIGDFDKDYTWYKEAFITGTPVNRLRSSERADSALKSVSTSLKTLYEKTSENIPLNHYEKRLTGKIEVAVSSNKNLSDRNKRDMISITENLSKILSKYGEEDVATVQSHGDFQPANILVDGDKTWLIDWEYTQRRQNAYDSLVFSLRSRFPERFDRQVEKALEGSLNIINSESFVNWAGKANRKKSLALFLLEEIDLRLMEISSPMIHTVDNGFFTFVDQAAKATQKLA